MEEFKIVIDEILKEIKNINSKINETNVILLNEVKDINSNLYRMIGQLDNIYMDM